MQPLRPLARLPPGYVRALDGTVQPGDRYLVANVQGRRYFVEAGTADLGRDVVTYTMVIRLAKE